MVQDRVQLLAVDVFYRQACHIVDGTLEPACNISGILLGFHRGQLALRQG